MRVLLAIGSFKFTVGVSSFSTLSRKASFKWRDISRFGQSPVQQFTGIDPSTIEIQGTSYQAYAGFEALEIFANLTDIAANGEPLSIVSQDGSNLGLWVIESVSSDESSFLKDGTPRKVDFKMGLKKYASV